VFIIELVVIADVGVKSVGGFVYVLAPNHNVYLLIY
jgi:hypothetical protein